ncbi:MAG TPA: hypothetical protein DG754_08180 [Bacteroidales bacterium]|nr:hypothetical protein [Bacteroidales bacterium]
MEFHRIFFAKMKITRYFLPIGRQGREAKKFTFFWKFLIQSAWTYIDQPNNLHLWNRLLLPTQNVVVAMTKVEPATRNFPS